MSKAKRSASGLRDAVDYEAFGENFEQECQAHIKAFAESYESDCRAQIEAFITVRWEARPGWKR